ARAQVIRTPSRVAGFRYEYKYGITPDASYTHDATIHPLAIWNMYLVFSNSIDTELGLHCFRLGPTGCFEFHAAATKQRQQAWKVMNHLKKEDARRRQR
ncbi:hypothetical protein BD779DRAFT_1448228, partial [Infundibulicybe gibba]